jgi:hypothetical protein
MDEKCLDILIANSRGAACVLPIQGVSLNGQDASGKSIITISPIPISSSPNPKVLPQDNFAPF